MSDVYMWVCFCSHQPANKQVGEDEADPLGLHAQELTPGAEHPLLGWSTSLGPPVAEKPRWLLGRNTPTQLMPINVSGDGIADFVYSYLCTCEIVPSGLDVYPHIHFAIIVSFLNNQQ